MLTIHRKPKECNVLVTGGTGFIGSHLVEKLLEENHKVTIPYINIENKSYFKQIFFSSRVTLEAVDITNFSKVLGFVQDKKIEYIFHLAAQTVVTQAYTDPWTTLNTNIMGTVNILEAARIISRVKGVIIASSDKAYGKTKKAYVENHPLRGDHPYDVSKSSADLISLAYYKTYKTPVVITRFGNVYGEGDLHFDRIIPGICKAIVEKKLFEIRSDGKYIRDYIYVKDVVAGYMTIFQNIEKVHGEAYNFSSKDTYSVLEVVQLVEKVLRKKIPYSILNTAKNEIPYQHLEDKKIRKLGWKPRYSLGLVLPQILLWYNETL